MKRKKKSSVLLFILLTILLVVIVGVTIIANQGYTMYKEAADKQSIESRAEEIMSDPDFVPYDKIPKDFVNAVIAVEDRRYFEHGAIDIISIGRAVITDIKNMALVEGGSTITQQLAKNMMFTQEKKFTRKIAEIFAAFEIEKKYSKEEIFAMYINLSYYGDGYYGLLDASDGYFKKDPSKLTLFEITMLAGLPNAPSAYAPTSNIELAIERQDQVIAAMSKNNYLTEEQIKELQKEQQKMLEEKK